MKKTFLARRNALLSPANFSWGFFTLLAVVLLVAVRFIVPNFFWQIVTPAFRASDAIATESRALFSGFANAAAVSAQNDQLKNENAALAHENQTLLETIKNIGALAAASSSPSGLPRIVAGVVARPPTSPYDTLIISGGAKSGVSVGQEAFGDGGVPLGVVSSVLPDFSQVTLFSAPRVAVDGWVGAAHVPLSITGAGGGTMRATLSRLAGVALGDTVFVSGPGMLPVGTVVGIDNDPSSPSVTVRIQPALNFFSVGWVELRSTGSAFAASLSWATSTLP